MKKQKTNWVLTIVLILGTLTVFSRCIWLLSLPSRNRVR